MRQSIITITAALAVAAAPAFAQTAPERYEFSDEAVATAHTLAERALDSDLAWEIVESLTTEIGPRLGGGEAEARARDWAVQMLTEQGFHNVAVEPFDMPYWTRGSGSDQAEVTAPFPQPLRVTALGGSAPTPQGGLEGEIVYFASFDDLAAHPGEGSLAGRIVFVDDRMVRAQTGAGYGPANRKRSLGWIEAQARGASALLIRSVGTSSHRFAHTGNVTFPTANSRSALSDTAWDMVSAGEDFPDVRPRPRIPALALSAPDADQLARIVESGQPARVRIRTTGAWRGDAVSGNVIAEIPGRELPDEIILIGAHLDSWDEGTGAIDDGAGVAIVVAAARLIADLPQAPRRTIRVVLFGAEEVGLLGAFAYARQHSEDLENHVLASESDFGAGRVWRFASGVSPEGTAAMDAIGRVIAPYGIIRGDRDSRGGGPDIIPLAAAGVPVFRLDQDGTDYFDLHHTPDDTLDKIDPEALAQNVAAWAATIWLASEADVDYRGE